MVYSVYCVDVQQSMGMSHMPEETHSGKELGGTAICRHRNIPLLDIPIPVELPSLSSVRPCLAATSFSQQKTKASGGAMY